MDWQFYTYCQNVSMYKTRPLSWISSSTLIVGMFLCIKLGSCHGLAVLHLLSVFLCIKLVSCHGLAVLHLLSECFYV